jgi:hypothetical protein
MDTDTKSQLQRLLEDDRRVAWNLWATLRKEHGPKHFLAKKAFADANRTEEALTAFKEDDGEKVLAYLKEEHRFAELAVDKWMREPRDAEGRDFFLFDLGMRLDFLERFEDQW